MTRGEQLIDADQEVLRAVALAASPTERLRCPGFVIPPGGTSEATARAQRWEEAVGAGQRRRIDQARQALRLDRDFDDRAFGATRVSDPHALPGWATALIGLLGPNDEQAGSGPLAALSSRARTWLDRRSAGLGVEVEASAREDLVAGLERRLWRGCMAVFDYEAQMTGELARVLQQGGETIGVAGLDGSTQAWRARVAQWPGLARVLGVTYHHWQRFTDGLLTRLEGDLPLLRDSLFSGSSPGPLVGVQLDLGDLHGGGQAVTHLTFAQGAGLFYKPKDLRIAAAFLELADFLNRHGLDPELPRWRVIGRRGYAWEEVIEAAPCPDLLALRRFYLRLGMLARLFQLLGARDMWLDNLVAAGEFPVFVDLETLLQPTGYGPYSGAVATEGARAATERWSLSVAALDMLAMPTPIGPDTSAEELGVLAPPGCFRSPFRYQLQTPADPGAVGPDGYILWHHADHAPTLAGQSIDPAEFFAEILDGYHALQRALVRSRSELSASAGPLVAFRSAPVRFIPRDTWTYLRLIDHSLTLSHLAEPMSRECLLARLFGALPPGTPEEHGAELAACEIEALRDLDVPYFSFDPAGTSVQDSRGDKVVRLFATTAWTRLVARVWELDNFPLAEEEALLRSTLATSVPGRVGQPAPSIGRRRGVRPLDDDELVHRAQAIGQAVLDAAAVGPRGEHGWLGLVDQPVLGCRQLQPIGPDPLSGTGGLALMFGELYAATGTLKWRSAAEAAVEGALAVARQAPERLGRLLEQPGGDRVPIVCGLVGVGGALYVLRALASLLGELGLRDEAIQAAKALPMKELGPRVPFDMVVGGAGLLLALIPSGQDGYIAADQADQMGWEILAESLFARAEKSTTMPLITRLRVLTSRLPDPAAALGLAASRLPEGPTRASGQGLVERLAAEADVALSGAWPGERLGMVLAALSMSPPAVGRDRVGRWIEALSARPPLPDDASSRRIMDELELLFLLDRRGDPSAAQRARHLVEGVITRQAHIGTWLPETIAADQHCLSTIDGLPALVHGIVRLSALSERAHGSLRTLELGQPV